MIFLNKPDEVNKHMPLLAYISLSLDLDYLQAAVTLSTQMTVAWSVLILIGLMVLTCQWCLSVRPLSRTTASKEPEEGTWQVSVVPAQADEVAAEHCSNTKVSLAILVCSQLWENKLEVHKFRRGWVLFSTQLAGDWMTFEASFWKKFFRSTWYQFWKLITPFILKSERRQLEYTF